jgi:hypothetical protein
LAATLFVEGVSTFETLDEAVNTICTVTSAWVIYVNDPGLHPDYGGYSEDALVITAGLGKVLPEGELVSESVEATVIEEVLESNLGAEVMGSVLTAEGALLPSEIEVPFSWLGLLRKANLAAFLLSEIVLLEGSTPRKETIFRVYDNVNAPATGRFWTPTNPLGVTNYRDRACLPTNNLGTRLRIAVLQDNSSVSVHPADLTIRSGCIPPPVLEYEFPVAPVQPPIIHVLSDETLNPPL